MCVSVPQGNSTINCDGGGEGFVGTVDEGYSGKVETTSIKSH